MLSRMKRLLLLTALLSSFFVSAPASATPIQNYVFAVHPWISAYSSFDNTTLPDCEYAADANLIQHEHPGAPIATADVVAAWQTHPVFVYWDDFTPLNFLETTGFGGFTISSYERIYTDAALSSAANAGGVYAFVNLGLPLYHALAVVGANATGPVVVWSGSVTQETWAWYDANIIVEYAVEWSS